jgi:acetolactate synthase-1/3 small subunit
MTDPIRDADVILIIYVHSRPGVLAKIASMFYRRGLNIRTLTVGNTHEPELAKIVVRVAGPRADLERLVPSLANLVDVLTVDMTDVHAARAQELCLVRVAATDRVERDRILAAVAPFQPTLVDAGEESLVIEVAGTPAAVELFIETIGPFGVIDVSRTGVTTLPGLRVPSIATNREADGDRLGPRESAGFAKQ